jgi:hypothetical protein
MYKEKQTWNMLGTMSTPSLNPKVAFLSCLSCPLTLYLISSLWLLCRLCIEQRGTPGHTSYSISHSRSICELNARLWHAWRLHHLPSRLAAAWFLVGNPSRLDSYLRERDHHDLGRNHLPSPTHQLLFGLEQYTSLVRPGDHRHP